MSVLRAQRNTSRWNQVVTKMLDKLIFFKYGSSEHLVVLGTKDMRAHGHIKSVMSSSIFFLRKPSENLQKRTYPQSWLRPSN